MLALSNKTKGKNPNKQERKELVKKTGTDDPGIKVKKYLVFK